MPSRSSTIKMAFLYLFTAPQIRVPHTSPAMQLCKAQEVKIRLTGDTWQQETCQRFLHKPDMPPQATIDVARAQPDIAPSRECPGQTEVCGYWQLAPGVRLRMLRDLCLAALDTYIFR